MLNIGDVVLHYRIAALIGRGETGAVYRVEDRERGEPKALKVLEWPSAKGSFDVARLRKEATAAQTLRHPNICRIDEIEAAGGLLCIVMELLEGTTLDLLINNRPLPGGQLLDHAIEIAAALVAAHKRAILHLGLKPSKVMVTATGVKLMDFGIRSVIRHAHGELLPLNHDLGGALSYASPEQVSGQPNDARSDLFSFGSVLYEMSTGRPPFRGRTLHELGEKILHEAPAPPSRLNDELPIGLEPIILRALEKNRDARYQNAAEMLSDLGNVDSPPGYERPRSRPVNASSAPNNATVSGKARGGVPASIARYQILRKIADGASSTVYVGRDPAVDRLVVIKSMRLVAGDAAVRILAAIRAAAKLHHPNIVGIFEVVPHTDGIFIVTEYVDGTPLSDINRRKKPLPLASKLEIVERICAGLGYLHENGVVHGDLAPASVLMTADGDVKIFGVGETSSALNTDVVRGTPSYMAPELLRGKRGDRRSDIFSLGVLFYELLSARLPFVGDMSDLLTQILDRQPAPLRVRTGISSIDLQIERIVGRCLEKDPDKRYSGCDALARDIAEARVRMQPTAPAEPSEVDEQTQIIGRPSSVSKVSRPGYRPEMPSANRTPDDAPTMRSVAATGADAPRRGSEAFEKPWSGSAIHAPTRDRFRAIGMSAAALATMPVVGWSIVARRFEANRNVGIVSAPRSIRLNSGSTTAVADAGPLYALVIGINSYPDLPALVTALDDAKAMESTLRENYGFKTELLQNPTRYQILSALNRYRSTLSESASLLIYYAGHGYFDKDADKAYWLPVDAQRENSANWIIADDITSDIRAIPARHILVISDSCYSGGLTRDIGPAFSSVERDRYLQRMEQGKSRTLLASGGNEPVADSGGDGGHSVFASALLKGLDSMASATFTGHELFSRYIGIPVAGRSLQTPQYTVIRNSGHDQGDFVFFRKKAP